MKITIIGAGNMGGAIARALFVSSYSKAADITCTARSQQSLSRFSQGFNLTTDNRAAVEGADLVIFAVKPWMMEEVVRDVAPYMDLERQIVASVAAGVSHGQLTDWLGGTPAVFQIMPNTAIEVGSGVTFISSSNASQQQIDLIVDMFSRMGYALYVKDEMMDAGMALASCGIAYAMKYIQASVQGGVKMGFTPELACKIVEHTVKGAAELLLATGNPPQTEIDKVTTPGGITMKGLAAMEQAGFTSAVISGLENSKK